MTEQQMLDVPAAEGAVSGRAGKYLTFRLGAEEYGVEIQKVREIIGLMEITWVPRTPEYIRGVINLRGKVVPVMDLRQRFDMETVKDTEQTCIVVVEITTTGKAVMTGVVVDCVSEVLDITENQIEETPSFGTNVDMDFITGIAKQKNEVKILIDIEKVVDTADLSVFDEPEADEMPTV
jgi:purine-binding chemotaxis protein CheW